MLGHCGAAVLTSVASRKFTVGGESVPAYSSYSYWSYYCTTRTSSRTARTRLTHSMNVNLGAMANSKNSNPLHRVAQANVAVNGGIH